MQDREPESMGEITARWRRAGIRFRQRDVSDEWERQALARQRDRQTEILAAAARLKPTDQGVAARQLREVAGDIADHRGAGTWTTAGKPRKRPPELKVDDEPTDETIALQVAADVREYRARLR